MTTFSKWMTVDRKDLAYVNNKQFDDLGKFMDIGIYGDNIFFAGGHNNTNYTDVINLSSATTAGNATDYGDLILARSAAAGTSNGQNNRGIVGGGWTGSAKNNIDYFSMNSATDASDFGDLTYALMGPGGLSNNTNERGVFGGGFGNNFSNIIQYITINSTGNATDFGDMSNGVRYSQGVSNSTNNKGGYVGGQLSGGAVLQTVDYITINSTGNASGVSTLTYSGHSKACCSNYTNERGMYAYGYGSCNRMEYWTINTESSATYFSSISCRWFCNGASNGEGEKGHYASGYGNGGFQEGVIRANTINTASSASDWGDLTQSTRAAAGLSNA